MRTLDRLRAARGGPTNVAVRLMTMLAMLGVLMMLIVRAADPATWRWIAGDHQDNTEKARQVEVPIPDAVVTAPREEVSRGPTDTDMEELAAAVEESQAISDHTVTLQTEEMPAYWRLFSWVEHQSFSMLQGRASKSTVLNDFMQSPDVSRRRIVQLELNVRRVLKYDAPENTAGIEHVYEVWGWTDESQAWPYVVVTPHLPPGMPVGANVHERATFAGYFFKLQGYHAAGARPNDKSLSAPLFIGRLSWHPSAARLAQKQQDSSWIWWLGLAAVAFGGVRLGLWYYTSGTPRGTKPRSAEDPKRLNEWLRKTEDGDDEFEPPYEDDFDGVDSDFSHRNGKHPHKQGDA